MRRAVPASVRIYSLISVGTSNMRYYALFLMIICYIGCGESDSYIRIRALIDIDNIDVEIYSPDTPIDNNILLERYSPDILQNRKGVIAFIETYGNECDNYGIPYLPFTERGYIWKDGDTIEIEVFVNEYEEEVGDCPTVSYIYREAIFVGFCSPGEYTLRVNDTEKKFTVD